jgi:sec-independent protein translocase protein TatA
MGLGLGEAIVIGFILLVVFSAARMGQLGNAVGKFVYSFRRASQGQDLVDAKRLPSRRPQAPTDAEFTETRRR